MNRRWKRSWIAAALAAAGLAGPDAMGAAKRLQVNYVEVKLPAGKPSPAKIDTSDPVAPLGPVAGAAPYRRLPSGYGKIGLTDRQRDRIYALRGGYRARIEQLETELAALKAAETEACESVLTEDQKAALERGKKTARKAAAP